MQEDEQEGEQESSYEQEDVQEDVWVKLCAGGCAVKLCAEGVQEDVHKLYCVYENVQALSCACVGVKRTCRLCTCGYVYLSACMRVWYACIKDVQGCTKVPCDTHVCTQHTRTSMRPSIPLLLLPSPSPPPLLLPLSPPSATPRP